MDLSVQIHCIMFHREKREIDLNDGIISIKLKGIRMLESTDRKALYSTWKNMLARCTNPKNPGYKYCGGRGIVVCERWQEFENFISDMGPRPSRDHFIYRIDENVGYGPDNCRWATHDDSLNRTGQRLITYKGETLPLYVWAKRLGMKKTTLYSRIAAGWSIEKAMSKKLQRRESYNTGHYAVRIKGAVKDKVYDKIVLSNKSLSSCWDYLYKCVEKCLGLDSVPEFILEDLSTGKVILKLQMPITEKDEQLGQAH
jgi:hypothetical protein